METIPGKVSKADTGSMFKRRSNREIRFLLFESIVAQKHEDQWHK